MVMRLFLSFTILMCATSADALTITIDNYGMPGAVTDAIRTKVFDTETTATHHDIWIIEGGVNDLSYSEGNYRLAQGELADNWTRVRDLAQRLGVEVYFSELTPLASAELNPITSWAPVAPKMDAMNLQLAVMEIDLKIRLIRLYTDLEPHWTALPDAWCLNLANNGKIDGLHANALGARAIADRYYAAIRPSVLKGKRSVAIFGDSIVATTYLPPSQRIDALMRAAAASEVSAARPCWQLYE